MAVGAITLLRTGDVHGGQRVTVNNVIPTSGANYATGGSVVTAAQLGLQFVQFAICEEVTCVAVVGPGSAVAITQPDGSIKLKCNVAAGNAENAGNADLSGTLVKVTAFGY